MTQQEIDAKLAELPASMRKNVYTKKVVTTPIPEGSNLVFDCSKQYVIACNEPSIRESLIGMAERLEWFRTQYWLLAREVDPWKPASESPEHPGSSVRHKRVMVDSGVLHYIGGINLGYHDYETDTWYVILSGKAVAHKVEYWRHPPCGPSSTPKWELVKDEIERLRSALKTEPHNVVHSAYILLRELSRGKSADHKDVRYAMEDLRKGMNERQPGSFPDSLLGDRPDSSEDVMTEVANVLSDVRIAHNSDGTPNPREFVVSRRNIEQLRESFQDEKPDGGYSRPFPTVVDGKIVPAEDDGIFNKPRKELEMP